MSWFSAIDNLFITKLISTAILIVLIFGLRTIILQRLLERETLTTILRRRWMVATRNAALFLVLTCLVVIWFEQLRALAATVVVIAVAIVVATKELLLNIVVFLSPSGAHFFSIGDRIEVGEVRGDVIDQTMMGTTILEIGPGAKTHQYTGGLSSSRTACFLLRLSKMKPTWAITYFI